MNFELKFQDLLRNKVIKGADFKRPADINVERLISEYVAMGLEEGEIQLLLPYRKTKNRKAQLDFDTKLSNMNRTVLMMRAIKCKT